ncbi:hypothetical protein GpartN1_g1912.t1 [Galdieria partita]|uniref:Glycosyl transferase family 1 domain-containing protein n=1 Tax=Galdieria partita TaxID=83374 RepID=A0A9C7UP29_9RHOD|nr:hypothetical protein GpartN1_g1912.t1 [Galdieria partita]
MTNYLFLIEPFLYDANGVAVCYRNIIRIILAKYSENNNIMIVSPDEYREEFAEGRDDLESLRLKSYGVSLVFYCYDSLKFIMPGSEVLRKAVQFQPDVIHCIQPGFCSFWGSFIKHVCRLFCPSTPVLTGGLHSDTQTMVGMYNLNFLYWPLKLYLKLETAICDAVLCVDHRRNAEKFHLWKLGVDTRLFHPKNDYCSLGGAVIIVARLAPEKNLDLVIHVANLLPQYTFSIYGDGPLRETLRKTVPNNVLLKGAVSQQKLAVAYRNSDVSLVPGTAECHPLSLIESLATGTPVVVADEGGTKPLIAGQDGKIGYFYHSDENALSVSKKLWLIMENQPLREEMGRQGVAFASTFTWDKCTKKFLEFHEQLIINSKKRKPYRFLL